MIPAPKLTLPKRYCNIRTCKFSPLLKLSPKKLLRLLCIMKYPINRLYMAVASNS